MQRSKTITIGERDITITELNVQQIQHVLDELEKKKKSCMMDMLFPDKLPAVAVSESTGIAIDKLEDVFCPSELKQIIDGVENLNPIFTNMMHRLVKAGETLLREKASKPSAAG